VNSPDLRNHPVRMTPAGSGTATVAAMTNSRNPERAFRLNSRPLIAGGVLMGLGGVLGLAGIVVSGSCMAAAVRDWANRQEVPPTELARHHWHRAKAATAAGTTAWRNGTQEHAAPHS
jgi:H+/Cl- antiporter ClcA